MFWVSCLFVESKQTVIEMVLYRTLGPGIYNDCGAFRIRINGQSISKPFPIILHQIFSISLRFTMFWCRKYSAYYLFTIHNFFLFGKTTVCFHCFHVSFREWIFFPCLGSVSKNVRFLFVCGCFAFSACRHKLFNCLFHNILNFVKAND